MENQVWVKVSLFLKEFGQCQFHAQENNILPDQILIILESLSVLIFLCNLYNPLEDMPVPIFSDTNFFDIHYTQTFHYKDYGIL